MTTTALINATLPMDDVFCEPPKFLEMFARFYLDVHKYLALVLCIFGATTNLINIVVLNQKNMVNPTNILLTALSVSDGIMGIFYIPFVSYFTLGDRFRHNCPESYSWLFFLFVQSIVSYAAHAFSSWITVTLAIFRLIYIKLPVQSKQLCTATRSKLAIVLAFIAAGIMVFPYYLAHQIHKVDSDRTMEKLNVCSLTPNTTHYEFKYQEGSSISSVNFWVLAICIKCLPVLSLTVLSILLISSLRKTEKRRRTLKARSSMKSKSTSGDEQQTNRTTKLLITIVLVCVICLLPQAVFLFVLGSLPKNKIACFSTQFYHPFGDFFDLMTLFNHSINFVFYMGMSNQFRETFKSLLPNCLSPCKHRINNSKQNSQSLETKVTYHAVSNANGKADMDQLEDGRVEIE